MDDAGDWEGSKSPALAIENDTKIIVKNKLNTKNLKYFIFIPHNAKLHIDY